MQLDPLNIFLLPAGTIFSFISRQHWRDIAGGKFLFLGTVCFQQVLPCCRSVNTFSSGWLLHCIVVSSCPQFLAPTSVDFSVEALWQNTSQWRFPQYPRGRICSKIHWPSPHNYLRHSVSHNQAPTRCTSQSWEVGRSSSSAPNCSGFSLHLSVPYSVELFFISQSLITLILFNSYFLYTLQIQIIVWFLFPDCISNFVMSLLFIQQPLSAKEKLFFSWNFTTIVINSTLVFKLFCWWYF